MARPLELVRDRDRQVGDRDPGRLVAVHQQLIAAYAVGAGPLARRKQRGRAQECPVQCRVAAQRGERVAGGLRAGHDVHGNVAGEIRRIDQLHARRDEQAAGAADDQEPLDPARLDAAFDRGTAAEELIVEPGLQPISYLAACRTEACRLD